MKLPLRPRSRTASIPARLFALRTGVGLGLIALVAIYHALDRRQSVSGFSEIASSTLGPASNGLTAYFTQAVEDVLFLGRQGGLVTGDDREHAALQKLFVDLAETRGDYLQLRFPDETGIERVRVDFDGGAASIADSSLLQDKSARDYFVEGRGLAVGEVFVTRLDLNVERGEIERPLEPTIRFLTPVAAADGRRTGYMVINYSGEALLRPVALADSLTEPTYMLLNEQGYWLYSGSADRDWRFQLPHGRRFADEHDAWHEMGAAPQGRVLNAEGLFDFLRISSGTDSRADRSSVRAGGGRILRAEGPWYLVAFTPRELLLAAPLSRLRLAGAGAGVLFVLFLPLSGVWARRRSVLDEQADRIRVYARIVEEADELIYVLDPRGNILWVNPAFERVTGYRAEEVLGRNPRILKSGAHPEGFYRSLWGTVLAGESFKATFVNRRKDGSTFYEAKEIVPLRDDQGAVEYFVSIGRDLSSDFTDREVELERASRISGSIAHHYNNLLAGISGYGELALAHAEASGDALLQADIGRLMVRVRDAAAFTARIQAASVLTIDHPRPVDLVTTARDAVRAFAEERSLQDVQLSFEAGGELPGVLGNGELVAEMIQALLHNALDAVGEQGTIVLLDAGG